METVGDKNKLKKSSKIYCNICDYETSKKSNYDAHVLTGKHQKIKFGDTSVTAGDTKLAILLPTFEKKLVCEICDKQYMSRNGLWKHKKKCSTTDTPHDTNDTTDSKIKENVDTKLLNDPTDKELIMLLIKENSELKNMMMDVIKNGTHNNNSHNKTFNLQVFLNEQCKDALNISEFVETIKLQLSDLETTGRLGYVEGVSKIINKNLNELETNKRPIHCSDIKREILYIKDDNKWVKDGGEKEILKKAVKQIANKNIMQINEWRKANPSCTDSESKKNDLYLKIVSNSMSGSTKEEQFDNLNKIMSKVSKEVVIDKL
jgi:hypothetical protein